jgi:hypothetical protein
MRNWEIFDILNILFYSLSATFSIFLLSQSQFRTKYFLSISIWNCVIQCLGIASIILSLNDTRAYYTPEVFLLGNMVGGGSLITVYFVDLLCVKILAAFAALSGINDKTILQLKISFHITFILLIPWIFLWGIFLGTGNVAVWTVFDRLKLKDITALAWGSISAICISI